MNEPRDDVRLLIDSCFAFATALLKKNGEFYPFGQTLNHNRELGHDLAHTGDEHPDSASLIADLRKVWRSKASRNEIVATAVAYMCVTHDSEDESKADAICIAVDHSGGISLNLFFPYTIDAGVLSVAKARTERRPPEVFETEGAS